jgi:hypothetical protein
MLALKWTENYIHDSHMQNFDLKCLNSLKLLKPKKKCKKIILFFLIIFKNKKKEGIVEQRSETPLNTGFGVEG